MSLRKSDYVIIMEEKINHALVWRTKTVMSCPAAEPVTPSEAAALSEMPELTKSN